MDLNIIEDFLNKHVPHLKLSAEHAAMLDEPVTPEEIQTIIRSLKTNKSPGTDGFGAEFYKAFAFKLIPQMTLTFNKVLTIGTFPLSWNEASIVVLPKKERHHRSKVLQTNFTPQPGLQNIHGSLHQTSQ